MFKLVKNFMRKHFDNYSFLTQSYIYPLAKAIWSGNSYQEISNIAYKKNIIAYRCINMIATSAASIPIKMYQYHKEKSELESHPLIKLIQHPNSFVRGRDFWSSIYTYKLLYGNAYVMANTDDNNLPNELYALRPDRVQVIPSENYIPKGYKYFIGENEKLIPVNNITGHSDVLHIKNFHPLSDWYGLSPIEAARYSIEQHNQSGRWNQSLLQNSARPSGALIIKDSEGKPTNLSEQQFNKLKTQIEDNFTSAENAGKPLLLEGGLEWKEMGFSPKDMDFISSKNSSARDIALAFGVPPQLLGIPGDNTYSNLSEARIALWEQTILPLAENLLDNLNYWFANYLDEDFCLELYTDNIPALAIKREKIWDRLQKCNFMTINEKRQTVGLPSINNGGMLK